MFDIKKSDTTNYSVKELLSLFNSGYNKTANKNDLMVLMVLYFGGPMLRKQIDSQLTLHTSVITTAINNLVQKKCIIREDLTATGKKFKFSISNKGIKRLPVAEVIILQGIALSKK